MRNTIIMLAVIGTLIVTTAFVASLFAYGLEVSFREALSSPGTFFFMLVFGWIPAAIVGVDLYDIYEKKRLDKEFA